MSSIKLIVSILAPKLSLLGLNLEKNYVVNILVLLNTLSPLPLVELKLDHNPARVSGTVETPQQILQHVAKDLR